MSKPKTEDLELVKNQKHKPTIYTDIINKVITTLLKIEDLEVVKNQKYEDEVFIGIINKLD